MSQAREFMTREVVTVSPDTPVSEIARLLLEHAISAVPVVDASDVPIGMVSEGDLIGRAAADRDARRDWWLDLLAEGEALAPEFLASLTDRKKTAREIMAAPVVTVEETTEAAEIAELLQTHRIKRLPVVRDGRITGIVSRADILRALVTQAQETASEQPRAHNLLFETIARLDNRFFGPAHPGPVAAKAEARPTPAEPAMSAAEFRALVAEFEHRKDELRDEASRAAAQARRERVKDLVSQHIADRNWQALLHQARQAAEHGEKEILLMQFPSAVCSDGGRAINVPDPDWPATLRGEPAEIFLHWEHELKPRGFHLNARVLDFPGGVPGDIGLFLSWE